MNFFKRALSSVTLLVAIGLGSVGCQSFDGAAPGSLASVEIANQPMAVVQAEINNVFMAHAFTGGPTGVNQFTFSRAGTSMDQLAYGSHLFQRPITVRVVVTTRQQTPASIVVGCNASIIESENDPIFQEVHPIRVFGKGPYEDLLKEVQARAGQ